MPDPISSQEQIQEITADFEFLKAAATSEGFAKLFFNTLEGTRTQMECFNQLNEKYFDLVGEYRYSDYNSFRLVLSRFRKRKNQ